MASQDGVLGQYTHGFAVFGAIAASYVTLKFLCSLWSGLKAYILAGSLGLRADLKKMGQWAGECEPAGLGIHSALRGSHESQCPNLGVSWRGERSSRVAGMQV